MKVNYLTAIEYTGKKEILSNGYGSYIWKWKCICGKEIESSLKTVISSKLQSCGCINYKVKSKNIKKITKIGMYKKTRIPKIKSKKIPINNTSGVKGISIKYVEGKKRYYARIGFQKKSISLGVFTTLKKAKGARELAEKKYFAPIIAEFESLVKKPTGNKK
jgi:hypothetical protein